MDDISFSEAVILNVPGIGAGLVTTTFEALECLENEWPADARNRHWLKTKKCMPGRNGWLADAT